MELYSDEKLDSFFMKLAIEEAWKWQGLTYPNPAVGAAVKENGRILSVEAHHKAGESHAEVRALLAAYEAKSGRKAPVDAKDAGAAHDFLLSLPENFYSDSTVYVTLEPCSHHGQTPSCAWLLSRISPKRVVIAHKDPVESHGGGLEILADHEIDISYGCMEKEAALLLEPFIIWQKRAFVLFKLAQTSNGRIGGGYLSSQESLEHVHMLRAACSRLLIGGNTVRTDRPKLDCRFIGEKAPDVSIFSKNKNFDKTIPLFEVPQREVEIVSNLQWLDNPGFVLVEGGEGMLNALKERIDWFLIYQTPKLSCNQLSYNIDADLTFLHSEKREVDLMIWSRFFG